MTESEWLTSTDVMVMLKALRDRAQLASQTLDGTGKPLVSERKLRLFACAFCRRIWHLLTDRLSRRAVEVAERFADGEVTGELLGAAAGSAMTIADTLVTRTNTGGAWVASRTADTDAWAAARAAARTTVTDDATDARIVLLRDIIGNPWRKYVWTDIHDCSSSSDELRFLSPCWRTWNDYTVVKIADAIYKDRAFERLPILADALEEAGCTDTDILDHCRQQGVHVRGCWVIDLLLGKM